MALIIADRVKETATTTGTGTFTLGGAVTGFRTFNAGIGDGNTTYYCIFLDGTNEYEVGLGTFTASNQLARDTVLTSSNSGSKVNFSAGIKSVFCTQPSSKAAFLDSSGNLSITTSNVTEGTNLYYTDARFDTRLATKNTANLTEGTNLYYTDARARAAISVSGNALSYNSSTGVLTSSFEESPTFTGNVVVSGNLTVTGTTTWLDSTNTQISDKNIVLNYASSDSSANADGAGLTIQDAVDASNDATILWDATLDAFKFSNNLHFNDGIQANFGTSSDLQILHDGSHSYIKDVGTGSLRIRGTDLLLESQSGETFLYAANNGAVTLYHDNSAKLATTSTGIDVTGSVVSDGLSVASDTDTISTLGRAKIGAFVSDYAYFSHIDNATSTNYALNQNSAGSTAINAATGQNVSLKINNSEKLLVQGSTGNVGIGTTSPVDALDVNGKIRTNDRVLSNWYQSTSTYGLQFSNSAGNIQVFKSDDGNLGIGTTSPSQLLHLASTNPNIRLEDTDGTNKYGQIRFNGTSFDIMSRDSGNAAIRFGGHGSSNFTEYARFDSSGNLGIGTSSPSSKLHVNGSANISGTTYINDSIHLNLTDGNVAKKLGSIVPVSVGGDDDTGGLELRSHYNNIAYKGLDMLSGGATRLFHSGNEKLATTSTGIDVTGGADAIAKVTGTTTAARLDLATNSHHRFWQLIESDGRFRFYDQTANAERLAITSAGNLGIGTTSPDVLLDLQMQNASQGLKIRRHNSSGQFIHIHEADGASHRIEAVGSKEFRIDNQGTSATTKLVFKNAGSTAMVIDSSQNVGIGTTSPSQLLHLNSTNPFLRIQESDATNGFGDIIYNSASLRLRSRSNTSNGIIRFEGNNGTTTTEYARFDSSGNLGIGTTSPSSKLHISGDSDTNSKLTIQRTGATTGTNILGYNYVGTFANSELRLFANSSEAMRIDTGGKLLVGKTTADATNTVGHELKANGIVVHTTDDTGTMYLNRKTSHGNIIELRKDNSAVGVIGTQNWGIGTSSPAEPLHIVNSDPKIRLQDSDGTNQFSTIFQNGGELTLLSRNNTNNGFITFNGGNGTAATEYGRFNTSGNLGIGTTSPSRKLHINGGTANFVAKFESTDGIGGILVADNSTSVDLAVAAEGNNLSFYNNSEKMRIDSSGNVGIGTTSPGFKLQINGTDSSLLQLKNTNGSSGQVRLQFNRDSATRWNIGANLTNDFTFYDQQNSTVPFTVKQGANSHTLVVSNNSNVGIGTSSPADKLHVNSGTADKVAIFESGDTSSYIELKDPTASSHLLSSDGKLIFKADPNNAAGSTRIAFEIDGAERARIDSSGNVGIGTTHPDSRLDVTGGDITVNVSSTGLMNYKYNNSVVGSITTNGVATAFNTSSDARLKDITGSARGLEVINELNPVAYDWKADGKSDEGLIAQEVKELVPNAVSETEEGYYQMDYSKLVTPLIKAVQELTAKVESLEAQLANK